MLHRQGYTNVTVYNFAIDTMTIAEELLVLKRFRELYAIDQVVFYTGANDVNASYMSVAPAPDDAARPAERDQRIRADQPAGRLEAVLTGPSQGLLATLDHEVLPRIARTSSLREGLLAADEYCRSSELRCDFVLQPVAFDAQAAERPRGRARAHARAGLSALQGGARDHLPDRPDHRIAGSRSVRPVRPLGPAVLMSISVARQRSRQCLVVAAAHRRQIVCAPALPSAQRVCNSAFWIPK